MSKEKILRLDRVLQERTGFSRKKAKGLLDQGRVLVNGRKVIIASWKIKSGDRVEILPEGADRQAPAEGHFLKVIYEDSDLLVVDKEAGIACEKSPLAIRPTMVAIVNAYFNRKYPHRKHHYLGLVHRLDQETSGLMVYSKTREGNRITDQFKRHTIQRRYLAVVGGRIEGEAGRVDGFLKKSSLLPSGKKVAPSTPETGRPATTRFRVLERYPKTTLLEVNLSTGRTHQIRVQMASIGHPVVGDKIYGNIPPSAPLNLRGGWGEISFPRQALHASFLGFHHPVTGKKLEFRSELPRDLRRLVERLRIQS